MELTQQQKHSSKNEKKNGFKRNVISKIINSLKTFLFIETNNRSYSIKYIDLDMYSLYYLYYIDYTVQTIQLRYTLKQIWQNQDWYLSNGMTTFTDEVANDIRGLSEGYNANVTP